MGQFRASVVAAAIFLGPMILGFGIAPTDAHAQDAVPYTVAGVGNDSCGTWTTVRRQRSVGKAWGYEQWVIGYLSGLGFGATVFYMNAHNPGDEPINPLHGVDFN